MSNNFDVIVIGGGPSGSAAAFTAARLGLVTCIIDKRSFPRDKLCGGLVTERSKNAFLSIFGNNWPEHLMLTSREIAFFSDGRELSKVSDHCNLHFTMRIDFDHYLLQLAIAKGALFEHGVQPIDIDFHKNSLTLSDGRALNYKILMALRCFMWVAAFPACRR